MFYFALKVSHTRILFSSRLGNVNHLRRILVQRKQGHSSRQQYRLFVEPSKDIWETLPVNATITEGRHTADASLSHREQAVTSDMTPT